MLRLCRRRVFWAGLGVLGWLRVLVAVGFPGAQPLVGEARVKEGSSATSHPCGCTRGAPSSLAPMAWRGQGPAPRCVPAEAGGLTVAVGLQVAMQSLWNIKVVVLVKPEHENRISHVSTSSVKTGIANTLGRSWSTCVARGVVWVCVRCTGRGPGTCALHEGVLMLHMLHKEGSRSTCVA